MPATQMPTAVDITASLDVDDNYAVYQALVDAEVADPFAVVADLLLNVAERVREALTAPLVAAGVDPSDLVATSVNVVAGFGNLNVPDEA